MGIFSDGLRRQLEDRAPELLQSLKDDKTGAKPLTATQRQSARFLLRKVMTQSDIDAELRTVPEAPRRPNRLKKKR